MPVYGVDFCSDYPGAPLDPNHICSGPHTHLAVLADWIRSGIFMESPGDILLNFGLALGIVSGALVIGLLIWLALEKRYEYR